MRLDTGRAKRTPNSELTMIPPTTRTRDSSDAKCAARGMRICTDTELKPISNDVINRPLGLSVMPASAGLASETSAVAIISLRFSSRSPRGTKKKKPVHIRSGKDGTEPSATCYVFSGVCWFCIWLMPPKYAPKTKSTPLIRSIFPFGQSCPVTGLLRFELSDERPDLAY